MTKRSKQANVPAEFFDWADAVGATAAAPFLVLDQDFRILTASRAFYEQFSLSAEVTVGRKVFEVGYGEWEFPELRGLLAESFAAKLMRRIEVTRAFGLVEWKLAIQARAVEAPGGSRAILVSIQDISPAPAPLLLPDVLERALPGILSADPGGQCISADARAAEVCGVSIQEARGAGWLRYADNDRSALVSAIDEARSARLPQSAGLVFRVPGRMPARLRITVIPFTGRSAGVEGFVFALLDLAPQQVLEERLLQTQKLENIGRLAGGVAHDFNNVLSAISSYAAQVLCDIPPSSPAVKPAAQISKLTDQAAIITRQLLSFSRRQPVRKRPLNLNHVVRDMEELLVRTLGPSVHIKLELDLRLGSMFADPGQIQQVILNLAINARDAMPEGGTLNFVTNNKDGSVMLEVSDTGIGMPVSTRDRIFEPFFTTKPPEVGTGLGLAIVQAIIQDTGATIEVDSAPGEGSTFRIHFPRVESTEEPADPAQSEGGAGTVLLVDDAPPVRSLVRELLEERGYNVLEAEDARAAIDLARLYEGEIHLLLTDILMNDMSGHELARHLSTGRGKMKVIYMSGNGSEIFRRDGESLFLNKPFRPETLLAMVRNTLSKG